MSQCPTVAKRIQLRHDVAVKWTTVNPILLAGEFAYESDTNRMKIGNGTSRWNDLPYFQADSGSEGVFDGGQPNSFYGVTEAIINCGGVT